MAGHGTVVASHRGRANARPMTGSAKQSIVPREERMDCFVAFAPRNDVDARLPSRGAFAPELCMYLRPKKLEGAGNAGCRLAPAASCAKKAHGWRPQVQPRSPGI